MTDSEERRKIAQLEHELLAQRVEVERQAETLVSQEHRLWPAIQNYLDLRDQRHSSSSALALYRAARLALLRRLFFSPAAATLSVSIVGLGGLAIGAYTAVLFHEQNRELRRQGELFIRQFDEESKSRAMTRRAQLLDIIYSCSEVIDDVGDSALRTCVPTASPRARRDAVKEYLRLGNADLRDANLEDFGFEVHDDSLRGADLRGVVARSVTVGGADLRDTHWGGAVLDLSSFSGSLLIGADFDEASLVKAVFTSADLRQSSFYDARASGVFMEGARLDSSCLVYTDLRGADLSNARLEGADLEGADLRYARLHGASLRAANLREADLRYTETKFLGQQGTLDLSLAILDGADLRQADLGMAIGLTQSQISRALGDSATKLPASLCYPRRWSNSYESARPCEFGEDKADNGATVHWPPDEADPCS